MDIANLQAVYGAETRDFERGTARVQRGISDTQSRLNRAGRSAQSFWSNMASNTLANLATNLLNRVATAVQQLIVGSIKSAASFDALKRGLIAISGSAEEAERQLVRLREVAKLPGLGFREAIQGSLNLQAVGFSAANAERALKAFGNAVAFTGGGKEELSRITVQLAQMSAKGKILSQDLKPIIEAAPAVGKALKDAFGTVDSEALQDLGLTTDQFLDKLYTALEKLPPAANGAKNAMENFGDAIDMALATIGQPLLDPLTRALDTLTPMLATAAGNVAQFISDIPKMSADLWASLPESYKAGLTLILNIVQSVGAQIVAWFTENMPLIRQTVTTVLTFIGDFWAAWGGTLKTIVTTTMNAVLGVIKFIMQAINGDWTGAWETLEKVMVAILNSLPSIIKGVLSLAVQAMWVLGKAIVNANVAALKALPGMLLSVTKAAFQGLWDLHKWVWGKAIELGKAVVNGIWEGIKSLWGWLTSKFQNGVQTLIDQTKSVLKMGSPSKVFIEIGKAIPQGLALGIESGLAAVERSMEKLLEATIKKFSPKMTVKKTAKEVRDSVFDALTKQLDVLRELGGNDSALATINRLLADPAVARIIDRRTASLLRFNATLEDTLKLSRERTVGLPDWMRATGEESRERAIGLPDWMRSTGEEGRLRTGAAVPPGQRAGDETRERRVLPDLVAEARLRAAQIADDLTGIIGGAFDRLLDQGWRGFLQSMLDSAKRTFSQIADELINQLLRGALGANQQGKAGGILGMIMGVLGSVVGGMFGGGGSTAGASALGRAGVGGAAMFAEGGFLPPGRWGIAGEEGPERIYGGRTGLSVIPNEGNSNTFITINVPVARSSGYTQPKSRRQLAMELVGALA